MRIPTKQRWIPITNIQKHKIKQILEEHGYINFTEALRVILALGLKAQKLRVVKYPPDIFKPVNAGISVEEGREIDKFIKNSGYGSVSMAIQDLVTRGIEIINKISNDLENGNNKQHYINNL